MKAARNPTTTTTTTTTPNPMVAEAPEGAVTAATETETETAGMTMVLSEAGEAGAETHQIHLQTQTGLATFAIHCQTFHQIHTGG
jgi:hypothetical protein